MMLLQAGQAGLYRKDSIWTDEIPPDMVGGCTLWIDGTDAEAVFKGGRLNEGPPADGGPVGSALNKVAPPGGVYKSSGGAYLRAGIAGGASAIEFIASGVTIAQYSADLSPEAAIESVSMSALVSASTKLIIAAINVSAAKSSNGNVWSDDSIFSDGDGYVGLHISDEGGVLTATAYNYVGGVTAAARTLERNAWQIVTMHHQAGQLRCRVNGGPWASTASGSTTSLAGIALATYLEGAPSRYRLAHLLAFNTPQTDAAISAIERWIAKDIGITPW